MKARNRNHWTARELPIVCRFRKGVREGLSEKVTFESRPERGEDAKHADNGGKSFLGRRDSRRGGCRGVACCLQGREEGSVTTRPGRGPSSRMLVRTPCPTQVGAPRPLKGLWLGPRMRREPRQDFEQMCDLS